MAGPTGDDVVVVVGGFNTSVDKFMEADAIAVGGVTRVRNVVAVPGGKGAHVALTAAALDEPVRLVGIIDGAHREWFTRFFSERGVEFDAVLVRGSIRTCVAIRDAVGVTTELLEPGPMLETAERDALMNRLLRVARDARVLVLSGSLPGGLSSGTYSEVIASFRGSGVVVLVDGSGDVLRQAVAARPFLVKPNVDEAASLVGGDVHDLDSALRAARAIEVDAAVVSLGAAGVAASWLDRACHVAAPVLPEVRNVVGSGDCLVGGMAVALSRGGDADAALRLGVACGAANALTTEAGLIRRSDVDALLPLVEVKWS